MNRDGLVLPDDFKLDWNDDNILKLFQEMKVTNLFLILCFHSFHILLIDFFLMNSQFLEASFELSDNYIFACSTHYF